MCRKIATMFVVANLVTLCCGASCRQETAQDVLATFLNTAAEAVAEQLVSSTAKPLQATNQMERTWEGWR